MRLPSGYGRPALPAQAFRQRQGPGPGVRGLVRVIATMRVLGLSAADRGAVVAAVRRLVAYLQGPPDPAPASDGDGLAGYYSRSAHPKQRASAGVAGWARGSAAGLAGLSGLVSGAELERLLTGRHAISDRPLLPASGSAGRAGHGGHAGPLPEVMTLDQAAEVVGVSTRYLRRLAAGVPNADGAVAADRRPPGRPAVDRLAAWREAGSGRWLVRRGEVLRFAAARVPPTVVIGFDLVCSAPKSVSVLWAFADEPLRADIAAALDAGVDAALAYLERHAAVGTVGGRNRPGLGLAAASYRHEVSRADEAHLHVHNVIVNAVAVPLVDGDGRPVLDDNGVGRIEWRALDGEVLLSQVKTAGYVGAAVLRRELAARRGLVWGPVRNGVADLAGFPRELVEAFSTRRGQVLEEFAQLVDAGFAPDPATMAAAQRRSRDPKRVLADAQVDAIQAGRLATAGWTRDRLLTLAAPTTRQVEPPDAADVAALYDRLAGPGGLTERATTFDRREVVQAVAAWAGDRLDAEAIETVAARFLADPRVVLLSTTGRRSRSQPEPTYTTTDLLNAEQRLLALCATGITGGPRLAVAPRLIAVAITTAGAGLPGGLTAEQASLVHQVLGAAGLVRPVIGPAGTGKTEAMRAVVHAVTAAGHRVVGTANGGRQAEELHQRLHIPTKVVAGWLTQLHHTRPADVWPPGTVLIVDEATQVSTRDAERLLHHAATTGTVAILVGDPAQLGSVGAGGWFTHLTTTTRPPALTVNQRQRGPHLAAVRAALTDLRTPPTTERALNRLAADNRIRVCADRDELTTAVVTDWYTDRTRHPTGGPPGEAPRMLAEHHHDTGPLNRAARVLLHADGTLHGPTLHAAGRDFQAGDEVITLTQTGHTLTPDNCPPGDYIRTGTIGTITTVHPDQHALTVAFPGNRTVHIGPDYLTHHFPDGRDGGLDHAYALTAHKAEGATLPATRTLATDTTTRAGLYVMLTRARHHLHAYLTHHNTPHHDDEDWLPHLPPQTGPLAGLADRLRHDHPDQPATTQHPGAVAAHHRYAGHSLAQLTRRRRTLHNRHRDRALLRHAEHAAEAAIAATAPTNPPPRLLARIGPRPTHGPDRATWDTAITALAVYHARWQPTSPADHPGPPPPPGPDDHATNHWNNHRRTAEQVAATWANQLTPTTRRAFHSNGQAAPRQRAITGIHALLDHGHTPTAITTNLTTRELDTITTPAAVLDHRVTQLLHAHRIDPTGYDTPPPPSQHAAWQRTTRLLHAAETNHLARQPTHTLHAETTRLAAHLTRHPTDTHAGERLTLLHAALARHIDTATAHFAHHPAGYLTALLGDRPTDPDQASTWDRHATAIEHYRHHTLGLPHGTPAAEPTAPPRAQALGPPPPDPDGRQHDLARLQNTLDLGSGL